ncbi:uncharacterized protein J3D65DRAFT_615752 [Phyllosticta citribraziliensis]|uniref:Secreted protein n=1 Tax=Phyllosticta citribraziliensis TaxID=989973 RepID=A0ABR1LZF2_9PEZI
MVGQPRRWCLRKFTSLWTLCGADATTSACYVLRDKHSCASRLVRRVETALGPCQTWRSAYEPACRLVCMYVHSLPAGRLGCKDNFKKLSRKYVLQMLKLEGWKWACLVDLLAWLECSEQPREAQI